MKKILVHVVIILMWLTIVNATCTVTLDKEVYLPGESATASMVCTGQDEEDQIYSLTWNNGTDEIEVDNGITPEKNIYFFETLNIPVSANWTSANVTLTGTNLEGYDVFNVTGNNTRLLTIIDEHFSPHALVGKIFSADWEVQDINGKMIENAKCVAYGTDESGAPLQTCGTVYTVDGHAICETPLDGVFKEGNQYLARIRCTCGVGDNKCTDEDGNSIEGYYGSESFPFTMSSWLTVNTVTDNTMYTKRQEIFICANVTNVVSEERLPLAIYHQVRCSAGEDNNNDTDRVLIVSDDHDPDRRGISYNTTQMQCKRFILPEPKYLQGKTSQCYASTETWVLNENGEEIYGYFTTSPVFNFTSSDINIQPDWERISDYTFNTIINLSEEPYQDYSGEGIGELDIRLNQVAEETLDHSEQYSVTNVGIENLLMTEYIKNIIAYNSSGDRVEVGLEVLEDGLLEVELRQVDISPTGWYNVTLEFENFNERIATAQEVIAGENKINIYDKSLYFANESIYDNDVIESTLLKFNITILQEPSYGDTYKVSYNFYPRSGMGEKVSNVETVIQGLGVHEIYFESSDLNPIGDKESYLVTSVVSMLDENMIWTNFNTTSLGILNVTSESTSSDITGSSIGSGPGYYDVVVNTSTYRYLQDQVITADILIINTGDAPDQDTILEYYLVGPNGEEYGAVVEQILEVPPGETTMSKSIALPTNAMLGHWRFVVEYNTVVQPKITVYDTFEIVYDEDDLLDKPSIIEKTTDKVNFVKNYVSDRNNLNVVVGIISLLMLLIFVIIIIVMEE